MSRTLNSKRNIVSGILFKLFATLLPFAIRTAIIYSLGTEYLGVTSLFTSILSVLSLTELGFSSAIVYSMYKPIAANDENKICALLDFYKKIYRIVGIVILALGIILIPLLRFFIKGSYPNDINIYLVYTIYMFNTVISYFLFAYKSSIAVAYQRSDLLNKTQIIVLFFLYGIQLIILFFFKNFYAYCITSPISTVLGNLINNYKINKFFPNITGKGKLEDTDKREIATNVKGLFLDRIGDVSRNSFDNIVISSYLGLSVLAVFNNYYYIVTAVCSVLLIIKQGIQASIGNSIATETIEKNYSDFLKFNFIIGWIISWCFVCFLCLYQPFMELWVGPELKLSNSKMILFCIFFYSLNINIVPNLYLSGNGLWWECKLPCIFEAIGNLLLNIILCRFLGITGVLLATILTLLLCNFVWRNLILFKKYFKVSPVIFFIETLFYCFVTIAVSAITYFICELSFNNFVTKLLICITFPNFGFFIFYFKLPYFKQMFFMIKK
ncbi:MAG: lipopolysaccharide biosynthesis protein [Treponema sp.]